MGGNLKFRNLERLLADKLGIADVNEDNLKLLELIQK